MEHKSETLELKLELLSATGRPALEHEVLATSESSEWMPTLSERVLLLLAVWVVTHVESLFELRVGQDFVRLVDAALLLLYFLGRQVPSVLIRVVLLGEFSVGALDLAFSGFAGDAQDFVVVFGLGAAKERVRIL